MKVTLIDGSVLLSVPLKIGDLQGSLYNNEIPYSNKNLEERFRNMFLWYGDAAFLSEFIFFKNEFTGIGAILHIQYEDSTTYDISLTAKEKTTLLKFLS